MYFALFAQFNTHLTLLYEIFPYICNDYKH